MSSQFISWWTQIHFPKNAKASLGFGSEYWVSSASNYEGWEQLRDRYKRLGRRYSTRDIAYQLAEHLLDEVIVAAGGVEAAVLRLRAAIVALKAYTAQQQMQATQGVPFSLNHQAATDAWYAFADVLSWSRTVVERAERRAENPTKFPKQGLVPALKPKRLQKRCNALLGQLRAGPVGQTRPLSNFMLHAALVRHPFSGVELEPTGTIILPIPDAPGRSIHHWYSLTWTDRRDGVALTEQIWNGVRSFVDGVIVAFEKSVPRRLRK